MKGKYTEVLILVVMEEGQRPFHKNNTHPTKKVLILVVMEEGQRLEECGEAETELGLNPCCNGRGSKTIPQK